MSSRRDSPKPEKKDQVQLPRAHAGKSGKGTDNTQAGSGNRGQNQRRRASGPPEGK